MRLSGKARTGGYSGGAVFSSYEFKWPLSDRLTDEAWQEMGTPESGRILPCGPEVSVSGETFFLLSSLNG
ncbi:MAG: DUF3160 domain-containing protein [Candidatus Aminicenantes bacterium]